MARTPYDALAPHFAAYARTRARYCDAVDRMILSRLPTPGGTWLDVGSGDGGRAMRLARAHAELKPRATGNGATRLVLSDPSEAMAALCRSHRGVEVWQAGAEELPIEQPFDVVTCLWNVLGSIEGTERRMAALKRMHALVGVNGRAFIDVHNRYNARAGGALRVAARVLRDRLQPSERNGSVSFVWDVGGELIPSIGYLFAPGEMTRLLTRAGFRIVDRCFLDYDTGEPGDRWGGQMFFELAADSRP